MLVLKCCLVRRLANIQLEASWRWTLPAILMDLLREKLNEGRNSYDLQGLFWILAGGFDDTQKPMAMVDDDDDA